jgi:hypothetical protein
MIIITKKPNNMLRCALLIRLVPGYRLKFRIVILFLALLEKGIQRPSFIVF